MSRWIDADAVIREIAEKGYDKAQTNEAFEAVNDACDIISDAPSIDLVRCGECIRWEKGRVDFSKCKLMGLVKHDDFCSYGERRE